MEADEMRLNGGRWLKTGGIVAILVLVVSCDALDSCGSPRPTWGPPPMGDLVSLAMVNPRVISEHPPGAFIVPLAVFPNTPVTIDKGFGVGIGEGSAHFAGTDCDDPPCGIVWGDGILTIRPQVGFVSTRLFNLTGTWAIAETGRSEVTTEAGFRSSWTTNTSGSLAGTFGDYDDKGTPKSVIVDYTGTETTQGWRQKAEGKEDFAYEDQVAFKVRYDVIDWVAIGQ